MKLVPLFGFFSRRRAVEDDEDLLEDLVAEQIQLLTEDNMESEEEESESQEEDEEEDKEEMEENEGAENMNAATDDMLKVFVATEQEFTDMSSLVTEVEDVSVVEILADLRQIAAAFNIPPQDTTE
jgi:hypothetical protein